jgi:hypothetical protein
LVEEHVERAFSVLKNTEASERNQTEEESGSDHYFS